HRQPRSGEPRMAACSFRPTRRPDRRNAAMRQCLVCLAAIAAGATASANEPLHLVIDRLVALQTADYDKLAAPLCADEEFLRRISLDLVGAIPTAADARVFLADAEPNKREKLVDKLL